jgi:hypothetical protein
MKETYFLTYTSYLEPFESLSDAELGRLYRAAIKYAAGMQIDEFKGNEKIAFAFVKNQIDRDIKKYEEKCEQNRENAKFGVLGAEYGKLGGRPKKTPENPHRGIKTPYIKENEKENEKENKNELKESICTSVHIPKKNADKQAFGEFENVLLTTAEYEKFISRAGETEGKYLIEQLSCYLESKGKKYKSHYATLINWHNNPKNSEKRGKSYAKNGCTTRKICTEYSEGDEPPEGIYD